MKNHNKKQGEMKKSYYKTKSVRWSIKSWERFNKMKKGTSEHFINLLLDKYEND